MKKNTQTKIQYKTQLLIAKIQISYSKRNQNSSTENISNNHISFLHTMLESKHCIFGYHQMSMNVIIVSLAISLRKSTYLNWLLSVCVCIQVVMMTERLVLPDMFNVNLLQWRKIFPLKLKTSSLEMFKNKNKFFLSK